MPNQSLFFRFPYKKIKTEIGIIPYPLVPIQIFSRNDYIQRDFVVDTGADVTTLPKYMSQELEIDLKSLEVGKSQGIGEGSVRTWESKINIKIGTETFPIRCSFVSSNKIPPLLGKVDIFARFNLNFDNDKEELVLIKR